MASLLDRASREVRVVALTGALRLPLAADVPGLVAALLAADEREIALDLNAVTSIDAAGIGELIRAYNLARAGDDALRIVNPNWRLCEILRRVGLLRLLADAP